VTEHYIMALRHADLDLSQRVAAARNVERWSAFLLEHGADTRKHARVFRRNAERAWTEATVAVLRWLLAPAEASGALSGVAVLEDDGDPA